MFEPIPTPKRMAAWDRASMDEYGIKPEILMENAGRAAVDSFVDAFGDPEGARILCLAGSGNNGGDAFVMARHLQDLGAEVFVLHKKARGKYGGEAGYHARLAHRLGVPMMPVSGGLSRFAAPWDAVVDGLLGTGFSGEVREDYLEIIEHVNALPDDVFVFSIDVPSGLDGATGVARPQAVRAHVTVTFEAAKIGLVQPWARGWVGQLDVRRIGIPEVVREQLPAEQHLVTSEILHALPRPARSMHKGDAGHVLIVGGSGNLRGAPLLAALGALRGGAGQVTVAAPAGIVGQIIAGHPDVMALAAGSGDDWTPEAAQDLAAHLERFDALVVGPGLGRSDGAGLFLAALLEMQRPPTVIDADALYGLARAPELMDYLAPHDVLTPHPKEMARLMNIETARVQADRFGICRELAARSGAVAMLKGAGTVIADPDGWAALVPVAEPCLAAGGSGDVLAGLTARCLAVIDDPLTAASLAAFWHGMAGREVSKEFPMRGNLASEIAQALPHVLEGDDQC